MRSILIQLYQLSIESTDEKKQLIKAIGIVIIIEVSR